MDIENMDSAVDYKELDAETQKKSVKLVVMHMKKKIPADTAGVDRVLDWIDDMDVLLEKEGFDKPEYIQMRKKLNDAIGWVVDTDLRHRLRNSWSSFGKALEKKAPRN